MTCVAQIGSFVVGSGLGLKTGRLAADIPKKVKKTSGDSLGFQKNDDPLTRILQIFQKNKNGCFQISSFASLIALGSSGWFLRVFGIVLGVWCCPFGLLLGCLGSLLAALGLLLGATWSFWVSLGASCGSVWGSLGHLVAASGWSWLLLAAFGLVLGRSWLYRGLAIIWKGNGLAGSRVW